MHKHSKRNIQILYNVTFIRNVNKLYGKV